MARKEFPARVKGAVIKRATRNDVAYCEKCGAMAKRFQIDHIIADGLLGEPTIENAQLIGECCYLKKNAEDTTAIARAKRREARDLGAVKPKGAIPKPFSENDRRKAEPVQVAAGLPNIWRRFQ